MTTKTLPTAVRRSQLAVFAVAAIHVVALVLLYSHRDVIHAAIAAQHPGADVDALADSALWQSIVPHVVLAILLPVRALRLASGRKRSRTILTVILGIQIAAHATLPMVLNELPGYAMPVVLVQAVSFVFEVSALVLLWSGPARRFFSAPRPAETREPALAR
jgi:hypothetical protein